MEIYSELIKSIEQGSSLEIAAVNIKHKIIHFIEINKQEINLFKQQEILLQTSCNHYNSIAQSFADRMAFLNNIDNIWIIEICTLPSPPTLISMVAEAVSIFLNENPRWYTFSKKFIPYRSILLSVDYNQLSEQILYDLGIIINANRSNVNNILRSFAIAAHIFYWLIATYDWAITIRDNSRSLRASKKLIGL